MAMMTSEEAFKSLKDKGSLYLPEDGYHFRGISGKHLSGYCNIDPVLPFARLLSDMTETIVDNFKQDEVEVVFVPAVGAIPLAAWGPYHLMAMTGKEVLGIWADKIKPRGFIIERDGSGEALEGKKVLILEDMINKMFSVKELVKLAKKANCQVVGVGSIASNRDVSAEAIGVPKLFTLCEVSYDNWDEGSCDLCKKHVPMVIDIGHGDKFIKENPEYPSLRVLKI